MRNGVFGCGVIINKAPQNLQGFKIGFFHVKLYCSTKTVYCGMRKKEKGVIKTTCSKCSEELDDSRKGKYRYCKKCHASHMRATRPKHCELSYEQRIKSNARAYTNEYIRRGVIKKMPCVICGDEKSEAHHEDYGKPLNIVWYCRLHHIRYHESKRASNKEALS